MISAWKFTTPWPLLLKTGSRQTAELEQLLLIYHRPLFVYFRSQGLKTEDAEDLTQNLLMDFFLVKRNHRRAQPARGRFRDYLLASAKHALLDWRKWGRAQKRGGAEKHFSVDALKEEFQWEPVGRLTPEEQYQRQWARSTWEAAWRIFRHRANPSQIEALDRYYNGPDGPSMSDLAERLGVSQAALNSRLHKGRRHLLACLKEVVQATVSDPRRAEEEFQEIRQLLSPDAN